MPNVGTGTLSVGSPIPYIGSYRKLVLNNMHIEDKSMVTLTEDGERVEEVDMGRLDTIYVTIEIIEGERKGGEEKQSGESSRDTVNEYEFNDNDDEEEKKSMEAKEGSLVHFPADALPPPSLTPARSTPLANSSTPPRTAPLPPLEIISVRTARLNHVYMHVLS